jgi:preprotein translocase subunit SecA
MDVMRSGIGLRGLAQRDPLVEFKREAYVAFEQLKEALEHHIVDLLFRAPVPIQVQEPPKEALPKNLRTNADKIAEASGQAKDLGAAPARPKSLPAPTNGRARAGNGNGAQASNGGTGQGRGGQPRPAGARQPARSGQGVRGQHGGPRPAPGQTAAATAPQPVGAGAKIGRNDPCYCGSGKKYKMCHGR